MAIILKPTQEDIDNKFRSSYYKAKTAKKCVYCGSIFYYGKSSHMSCGLCSIKYNCKECNKEVVIQISKMSGQRQALIKDIIEKGTLNLYEAFCNQSCSNKNRTRPGICTSCGKFSNKRISSGMCLTCQKAVSKKTMEKYKKAGNCVKCNKYVNKRSPMGICIDCMRKHVNNLSENNKKPGMCTVCNKYSDIRTIAGLCSSCNIELATEKSKERSKSGLCKICNKLSKTRSITGICPTCVSEIIKSRNKQNTKPGKCVICNRFFNRRNSFGCCVKCSLGDSAPSFDREAFYKEKFKLISFDSLDQEISWDNIDSLKGIPGVWSVWSSNNECLDVCQTIDIGKEMLAWIRSYKACKGKSDEELIEMNIKYRRYNRRKKRDIAKHCFNLNSKPIFKVVSTNIETKEQREAIESQYAHDNKSIFWSPGLGQKITKGFHSKPATFSNKSTTQYGDADAS